MTEYRRFPKLNEAQIEDRAVRRILNRTNEGKLNVNGTLTLTANAAATTLSDLIIDSVSQFSLMAMSANAAAALVTTYFGTPIQGSVVINHANASSSDRIFRYSCIG